MVKKCCEKNETNCTTPSIYQKNNCDQSQNEKIFVSRKPPDAETKEPFLFKEISIADLDEDVRCGCCWFYPQWLQICASKKTFAVAYTIVLTLLYAMNSYFVGTISTIEKNYKMTSKMLGSIKGTAEIGGLLFNFALTYFIGKGNKAIWLAIGMVVLGVSSFVRTIPHFVFDSGLNVRIYTKEYNVMYRNGSYANSSVSSSGISPQDICDDYSAENEAEEFAFNDFLVAHMIFEMGAILLKTSGAVYLDDNTRKNIFPLLFSIIYAVRTIGTFIGFLLASYTLKIFVDPKLSPNIDSNDPRWIGAWWIGWIPIGTIYIVLAGFLFLFPRSLPRAAMRRKQLDVPQKSLPASLKDFLQSVARVVRNKIVLLDSFSSVCTKIGLAAFEIFLPKYIESQYGVSAANSSLLVGFIMLVGKSFSVLIVGMIITKFKPSPRCLMAANVLIGISCCLVQLSYILISCPQPQIQGYWNNNQWNLTEECNTPLNCKSNLKYSPLCNTIDNTVFYSPCHAGCLTDSLINNTKVYGDCACTPHVNSLIDGPCSTNCSANILTFLLMLGLFRFIRTSAKSIKKIMRFRFVAEEDKSLSLGINKAMLSLLAAFPSPIIYGMIFDGACILFNTTCGTAGNCWFYNIDKLKYVLNITACSFLLLGTLLDGILWYFIKGLKMYDEDFQEERNETEMQNKVSLKK